MPILEPTANADESIGFGVDYIDTVTGGTMTIPAAFNQYKLDPTTSFNSVTIALAPSGSNVMYMCRQDMGTTDPGPTTG